MFEQHNALIRLAVFVDGRDAHGGRIGQAGIAGLFQTLEQFEADWRSDRGGAGRLGYSRRRSATSNSFFSIIWVIDQLKIRRYILRLRRQELNRSDAAADRHSVNTQSLMTTLPLRSR